MRYQQGIINSQAERVTSQMKELFQIIEKYREIHGIDPLTGKVGSPLWSFLFGRPNATTTGI